MRARIWLNLAAVSVACLTLTACVTDTSPKEASAPGKPQPLVTSAELQGLADAELVDMFGGITVEAAKSLRSLIKRFDGVVDLDYLLAGLQPQVQDGEMLAEFYESLAQTEQVLALSNAGENLADPPVATGDELFDRYALAVDARIRRTGNDYAALQAAAVIPDDVLAEWQADFGTDPRYWELRYLCGTWAEDDQAVRHLQTAMDTGVASCNTVLVYYCARMAALMGSARTRAELAVSLDQIADSSTELFAILAQARRLGPDEAWPHYAQAFLNFVSDDIADAYLCLAAGNAAPSNQYPVPYPWQFVCHGPVAAAPAGSSAVSGAILLHDYDHVSCSGRYYQHYLELELERFTEEEHLPLMQDWHEFICRLGEARADEYSQANSAQVLAMHLYDHGTQVMKYVISAEQRDVLRRLRRARYELHLQFKADWHERLSRDTPLALGLVGGGQGICVSSYLEHSGVTVAHANHPWTGLFRQVDYTRLTLPDDLAGYEPLTIKELAQMTIEGRRAR